MADTALPATEQEESSSDACRLDSSQDTRGDYDASSSDMEDHGDVQDVRSRQLPQAHPSFGKFAAGKLSGQNVAVY